MAGLSGLKIAFNEVRSGVVHPVTRAATARPDLYRGVENAVRQRALSTGRYIAPT